MQSPDSLELKRRKMSDGVVLLVHGFVLTMYIVFTLSYPGLRLSEHELIYPLSLIFTLFSVWLVWTWRMCAGSLFAPYPVFLLAAIAFNGGQAILEVFGLNRPGMLGGVFPPATLVSTLMLVTIGLGMFHFGALCCAAYSNRRGTTGQPAPEWKDLAALRIVGWTTIAIALPAWWIESTNALSIVLSSGYMALYQTTADVGLGASSHIISTLLVPGAILLLVGSKDRRFPVLVAVLIVGANALLELFLGYRAYAIWPVLAFAWAYHRTIREIPRKAILGGTAVVLFVVFPLVRLTRDEAGSERTSIQHFWDSYASIDAPAVSIISEMGASMNTVAYTLDLVPGTAPFEFGRDYVYALSTIVPNAFGGLHPAIERGTASTWLIETVDPWVADNGGSIGYSFIAEAYRNFGWLGGSIALFVIGLSMASFFSWATRGQNNLKLAAAAIFMAFLSHYARGEFYTLVRPLVWYTLFPCLLVVMISKLGMRGGSPASERTGSRRDPLQSAMALRDKGQ